MEILEHDYYSSGTKIAGITIEPGAKCKPWPRHVVEECLAEIRLDLGRVFPQATVHILQQDFAGGHNGYCRVWNKHVHVFVTSWPLVSDTSLVVPYMHSTLAHELGHGFHHLHLMGKVQETEYLDKRYISSSLKPDSEWFAEDFRFVYGGELAQTRPHKGEQFFSRHAPKPDVLEWLRGLFDSALPEVVGVPKVIELWINDPVVRVDGEEIALDTEPIIRKDRTLVPLRFIAEQLGAEVSWDAQERKVTIKWPS